jgi:hypothetical protein
MFLEVGKTQYLSSKIWQTDSVNRCTILEQLPKYSKQNSWNYYMFAAQTTVVQENRFNTLV